MTVSEGTAEDRIAELVRGDAARDEGERRLEETIRELRSSAPAVPEALRERIQMLVTQAPPQPSAWGRVAAFFARLSLRRALLVLAPACVVAGLGIALVQGFVSAGSGSTNASGASASEEAPVGQRQWERYAPEIPGGNDADQEGAFIPEPVSKEAARDRRALGAQKPTAGGATAGASGRAAPDEAAVRAAALPPSSTRLQAYDATLRLRVRDNDALSAATRRAIRVTRGLGGYVASVSLNTPGREGYAALRLRIPIARIQEAITRFSGFGTLVGQQFRVEDLQRQANQQQDRIAKLRGRIERLQRALARPLGAEERSRLQAQLVAARQALARSVLANRQTVRRARLAQVTLSLTTREAAAVKPERSGRIERALEDAGAILAKEIAWVLYFLIVLAPLLVLGALAFVATRLARRRSDRLILERP